MAHTVFVDGVTVSAASWFNDVDTVAYTLFGNGTIYTGALTLGASGNITVNTNKFSVTASTGSTIVAGTLTLGGTTPASNSTISLFLQGTNTYKNWAITSNIYANGSLAFTPSTLNGGTNYSTPVLSLSSTTPGATITGALTVTDSLTAGAISGTTGAFSYAGIADILTIANSTNSQYIYLRCGGTATFVLNGAGGTGQGISMNATSANLVVGGNSIASANSTGLAVTGTLSTTGSVLLGGLTAFAYQDVMGFGFSATSGLMITTHITGTGSGAKYAAFAYATAEIGSITQSGTTAVLYNTTSDERLKNDLGITTDTTVLRNLRVHDFTWKATGDRAIGVFAQEAYKVFPAAVTPGTNGGDLSKPWQVSYSSYVPELIVGWQNHESRLEALERKLGATR